MLHKITNYRLTGLLFVIAILASCTIGPPKLDKDVEQQAILYEQEGNLLAAAEEYLRLAGEHDYYADYFYLKAARNYLDANALELSEKTLKRLRDQKLDPIQVFERRILSARIALIREDAMLALHYLDTRIPENVPADLETEYHLVRSLAFEKDGQMLNAFYDRSRYSPSITDEKLQKENQKKIWQLITNTDLRKLEKAHQKAITDSVNAGWLELGIIVKTGLYNMPLLESSISSWSKRYASHPAKPDILQTIMVLAREVNELPEQIALLLPFNETYREFSNAIRDGFMAAWYNSPGKRPVIRVYDTSQGSISDVYQRAVEEGAEFIVGPLEKNSIESLLMSNTLTIKTLTLNRVDSSSTNPRNATGTDITPLVYQFGLVPEDEANQLAEQIWLDGYSRALIITPDSSWGDRIYNAFKSRWTELGGEIMNYVRIFDSSRNYAQPVEELLNINNSNQRARELMATLGRKVFFEPRRRHDADAIFIAVSADMARQLVPQLRFYDAANIATYSISNIFTGVYDPQKDEDIENVIFSDMPWIVDKEYQRSPLQQQLNRAWQQMNSPYRRLYAFGTDAYQLIPQLGSLYIQGNNYQGNTGTLAVDEQGQVKRYSVWAKFVNGIPVMIQR